MAGGRLVAGADLSRTRHVPLLSPDGGEMTAWLKVVTGGVTGGTVIVGATVMVAMLADVTDAAMANWAALWKVLLVLWLLAAIVVGTVYYMHSPRGREVWTDEQR